MKIAVFVSGRGSNLKSLLEKVPHSKAQVLAVVSDKIDCRAFKIANEYKIMTYSVGSIEKLKEKEVELIVLAGFLKKIPDEFVDAFKNRIINIHPALLPSFGGKGMYGLNVHTAVFNSSAKISGATIHFVDKIYDNGFIIAQKAVDISGLNSPEEIADRVLAVEHELLPYVVEKFSEGKVIIENNRTKILD